MADQVKIDLVNDFTEEEMAAIKPTISIHKKEDAIVAMYKERKGLLEIMKELKVSTSTIYNVLDAHNVPLRSGNIDSNKFVATLTEEDKKAIIEQYTKTRKNVLDIAEEFGINKRAFYLVIDQAGVPRRGRGGSRKRVKKLASVGKDLPKAKGAPYIRVVKKGDELHVLVTAHANQTFNKVIVSYEAEGGN